jgi:hypothetical protein
MALQDVDQSVQLSGRALALLGIADVVGQDGALVDA